MGLGAAEAPLRAAAAGLGLRQLAAVVDPALARVGPRQSGQVLAALLRREQVSLLLIDAEADRGDGMLAAAAAHHLPAALLLGAEQVSRADRPDALEVALPLAGRRFQLQVSLPAVIVLAPPGRARRRARRRPSRADDVQACHPRPGGAVAPGPRPDRARPAQHRPPRPDPPDAGQGSVAAASTDRPA